MENASLSAPLQKLLTETLLPLAPDPVALVVIQAAGQEDVRAEGLAALLGAQGGEEAGYYRTYLFAQTFLAERMSEWLTENEGVPDRNRILLDRLVRLLGKVPVRNLVACARLERLAGEAMGGGKQGASGPAPGPGKEEGKITVTPSRVIPYALGAENLCHEKGLVNPDAAYCAGLHYDWLAAIFKKRGAPADEKGALDAAYKEGLAVGRMAYELGQRVGKVTHGKYLFAAGMLLPIGKALMAQLFPSSLGDRAWLKFAKSCEQAGERMFEHHLFLEHRRFPIAHAELGSLVANFGALLRIVEKAIYFYPYPDGLKKVDADLHQLASLLSIAARMARFKDAKPPLEAFHQRWMTVNKISEDAIRQSAASALKG